MYQFNFSRFLFLKTFLKLKIDLGLVSVSEHFGKLNFATVFDTRWTRGQSWFLCPKYRMLQMSQMVDFVPCPEWDINSCQYNLWYRMVNYGWQGNHLQSSNQSVSFWPIWKLFCKGIFHGIFQNHCSKNLPLFFQISLEIHLGPTPVKYKLITSLQMPFYQSCGHFWSFWSCKLPGHLVKWFTTAQEWGNTLQVGLLVKVTY